MSSASFWQITFRSNSCVSEMTHSGKSRQSLFFVGAFVWFFCFLRDVDGVHSSSSGSLSKLMRCAKHLLNFTTFILFPLDSTIIFAAILLLLPRFDWLCVFKIQ